MATIPAGTEGKVIKGAFEGFRARVVNDSGGDAIEVDVSIFGKTTRVTLQAHEFATEQHPDGVRPAPPLPPDVEPRFDLEPRLDYDALFTPGEQVVRLPALVVPSGELAAFDPFKLHHYDTDYAPFATRVAPGLYPVSVHLHDNLVAAAMVRFRSAPAARWRVATPWSRDVEKVAGTFNRDASEPYTYECRGHGTFVDVLLLRAARKNVDRFIDRLEATMLGQDSLSHGQVDLGDSKGTHVPVFYVGDGGSAPSWWGEAEDGTPVALVTDFFNRHGEPPPGLPRLPSRQSRG